MSRHQALLSNLASSAARRSSAARTARAKPRGSAWASGPNAPITISSRIRR